MRSRLITWLGLVAVAGLATVSCAQEREPINRVQPNAVSKSFFVGADFKSTEDDPEFYKRDTVVDVGYGAAQDGLFTSTYAQPISRIRWEVTENYLNARLAYERIQGTDGKGNRFTGNVPKAKATNDGQIVASYRIESHFDIRRDYNPQTGEELNVINENSTDRPWYDREFMRVDWSKNLITNAYDFDTLSMMGIFGGISYEPLSYAVLDPNDPDAPHFVPDDGYFDVTTKVFATPGEIDLSSLGWGIDKFPACMLPGYFAGGTEPYGNCNPVEVTLRQSYKRVVDHDYEQFDVDGMRFQSFGNFTTDYHGYARNYGMVDNQWFRFASRYNLWDRSHFYADPAAMTGAIACATKETTEQRTGDPNADPNRDIDPQDGTADECQDAGAGSKCDIFAHKCTLPYAARNTVTTAWYFNGVEDEDLFEATNWAVQEWDIALKTAVQTARLVECRKTGGADCDVRFPMWHGDQDDNDEAVAMARNLDVCYRRSGWMNAGCIDAAKQAASQLADQRGISGDASTLAIGEVVTMPSMLVLCHNPVRADDSPACGDRGLSPRLGDLRYNSVLTIDKPQQPSAWGIMVDGDDPLTGEKVAASINIWNHVTDLASQQLVDLIRYINGELPTSEITDGTYVRKWAQAAKLTSGGAAPTMSEGDVLQRLAATTEFKAEDFAKLAKTPTPAEIKPILHKLINASKDVAMSNEVASPAAIQAANNMKKARGTTVESQLMNQPMLQLAGMNGSAPVDGPMATAASPLALNNPRVRMEMQRMRENALASRGVCILNEAPEASSLTGLADILAAKFPKAEGENASDTSKRYHAMWNYIRRRYQYAVLAHEMGHSMGHRHNFVSTAGPLFFRPQYWQLRTRNGAVDTECTNAVADGTNCIGPRYYDPITAEEQQQIIEMFTQSTVMDYPGDVSQDMIGLGAYDYAATRFFYGDITSVYTNENFKAGSSIGVGIASATDTFGGLNGINYGVKGSNNQGASDFHYSQLQKKYNVIHDCYPVEPTPPAWWNAEKDGNWWPQLDGLMVAVNGEWKKCRQQQVDYTSWDQLRLSTAKEINQESLDNLRAGPNVDPQGRLRVPYHFATDHWADTGNVAVFRHDLGADAYEQMQFLVTTAENRHIFDNYRRGRTTFDVRAAADRSYSRYNEKMLNISSGIGFYRTIYNDLGLNYGYSFDSLWAYLITLPDFQLRTNVIAASVAFDQFARELSRPEAGPHYKAAHYGEGVLRSLADTDDYGPDRDSDIQVTIPNGSTGYLRDIGFGGHPLENAYDDAQGDYSTEYQLNAGSYYDKINTAILLSLSEDRFVSQSRRDFYDARFRATGVADIFPDGYRRLLANALTGDRSLLAPQVAAANGKPVLDTDANDPADPEAKRYPAQPMGWTSWWPKNGPEVCFPSDGRNACTNYAGTGSFNPLPVGQTVSIDPQVGWEVQKFLIAWTFAYIPANQKTDWLLQLAIYRMGPESDPGYKERVEFQDPQSGSVFVAHSIGKECIFGTVNGTECTGSPRAHWVEKGISARVLEYANSLVVRSYKLDTDAYPATDKHPAGYNEYGRPMVKHHPDGTPIILSDPDMVQVNSQGRLVPIPDCDQNLDPACKPITVNENHWAYQLKSYVTVPEFIRQVGLEYGIYPGGTLGLYP